MNTATALDATACAPASENLAKPWREDAAVIGLVGLAHGCSHFSHLLLAPLFPIFMREFGLSFAQLGLAMTVFFVISGVGQTLSGFVVDRVGARPVLFASMGCFMLATLSGWLAQGYAGLILVAVCAGLGNAPFHPVDFSILNQRVSPARLGYAYSVHGLSGNLGWALAPMFMVGFSARGDWRSSYLAALLLYGCIALLLFVNRARLRTEVMHHQADAGGAAAASNLSYLRLPVVWWCFGFFLLSTMTLSVVQTFSPSILFAMHHIRIEVATVTLTAYMICAAVGTLAGGFVATHLPRRSDRVVAVSMLVGAVLMALAATGWLGGTGSMAVLAAAGFAVGVGGPSRDLMIRRGTPEGATGRVYGTVYSGLDTGSALSPLLFGMLMDRGWYAATLLAAALTLLLSVGAALGVGRHTGSR
ncbi:MAG: MFS transporter [Burkholderiaceae bacterium]|jgi:MFS family permease|nr:MFS transporter [Burkholderiaceae bacterium]